MIGSKHLPSLTGFTVVNQLTSTTSLEVMNANGHFIGVPPIPNTLVLNVGDFLERATNHVFSSTIHRVIHLANVDRYSLAYFFDADPSAMIDIVETCLSEEHPRQYESIRAGLWQKKLLMWPKKIQCSSEDNHTA
jgi:isopenicillin N synthase-like dioxygenase